VKLFIIIKYFIFLILFTSCYKEPVSDLSWQIIQQFGEKEGFEEKIFFSIKDIVTLNNGNIVILDDKKPAILIFNKYCDFIKSIKLRKGKGPKEIIGPLEMTSNVDDQIFLLDKNLRRIYMIDFEKEDFIGTINLPENYPIGSGHNMKIDKEGKIWIAHKDIKEYKTIHIYSPNGDLLRSIIQVKPIKTKLNWLLPVPVYFDWYDDNIICVKENPYEIILYDKFEKPVLFFKTPKNLLKPIEIILQGPGFILPKWDKVTYIANILNKYVLTQIYLSSKNQFRYDLFDLKTGELIKTKSLPEKEAFIIHYTKSKTIFASCNWNGYPQIILLKLNI